jgi:hypothetical protein
MIATSAPFTGRQGVQNSAYRPALNLHGAKTFAPQVIQQVFPNLGRPKF